MAGDGDAGVGQDVEAVFCLLLKGRLYRFAGWPNPALPRAAVGVCTIWDLASGSFLHVGMAGAAEARPGHRHGLINRLQKHASGVRSGDRFCIHVQDRIVRRQLSPAQILRISEDPPARRPGPGVHPRADGMPLRGGELSRGGPGHRDHDQAR